MRLRTDFWVAAYLRFCNRDDVSAVLRRRGAAEAGAVFIKLDRLDGNAALFGPAPQRETAEGSDRRFVRLHKSDWIAPGDAEARLLREIAFDGDIWLVEVENRQGLPFVDVVAL